MKKEKTYSAAEDCELYHDVYREIAECLGQETAIAIFRQFGGAQISFPVHLYCTERLSDRLREQWDGSNTATLARKYGYSEKTVRRMMKERGKSPKKEQ